MRRTGKIDRKVERLANRRLESLSTTVNDLFHKAVENESILRRYQQFELKLLDVSGFEPLLDMLLHNSISYFQLECVELWLYDPQGTLTELLSDEYRKVPELRLLKRANELNALYSKKPEVKLVSTQALDQLPVFNHLNIQSAAMLPLVRHGILVGSLHLGAKGEQRFTIDKSTDFITHLASIVAVCLENGVNQERLHRLSMYDMLTQVKNRRAFHKALDEEVSRAGRNGESLSMLFIDLDFFKNVNDNYGHPLGDKVLKEVAQYIDKMLRKTDHVCRYGGEEFALVLPNCDKQRALDVAERIRLQISELVIVNDTASEDLASEISVTLSIGVCRWLPDIKNNSRSHQDIAKRLIDCSDRGVYQSKAVGRNCVHYIDIDS